MKSNLSIIATLLLLVGAIGALYFHLGALTPVVPPVIDTLLPPDAENEPVRSLPVKEKSQEADPDATYEEQYEFLDFHEASRKNFPYLLSYLIWYSGLMLLLVHFGCLIPARSGKILLIVASFLSLYGIKLLYQGAAGAIMAFNTMGLSGGSDPTRLSLSIGESSTAIMIGWCIHIVAAVCFLAARFLPMNPNISDTIPTRKSKVFATIGLGIGVLGFFSVNWNRVSYRAINSLNPENGPEEFAATISGFLMSHAFIVLTSFFAVVFFLISFLVRKKAPLESAAEVV